MQLDKSDMKNRITIGSKLNTDNLSDDIKFLIENEFIQVTEEKYIICKDIDEFELGMSVAGCEHKNNVENNTCENCGEILRTNEDDILIEREIAEIKFDKIIELCIEKLRDKKYFNLEIRELSYGVFSIADTDIEGLLIFNFYNVDKNIVLEAQRKSEKFLIIDIDHSSIEWLYTTYSRIYELEEFLKMSDSEIGNEIKYLPKESHVTKLMEERRLVENELISLSTSVSWNKFEGEIVDFILNKIKSKPRKVIEYKYLLRFHKSFAKVNINVGGAGNTDYRQINLEKYLDILFNDDIIIDAKRFSTAEINNAVLEKVEHHKYHDPSSPERIIIITTKNKVKCWNEIQNWYSITGSYKVIVLTPQILSNIICFFEVQNEIMNYLKKYR